MIYLAIGLGFIFTMLLLGLCMAAGRSDQNRPRDPLYADYYRLKQLEDRGEL